MTRLAVVAVLAFAATVPQAAAQSADRGKPAIGKLFAEAVGKAADATVRVKCDGKETSLGTVVDANGYILAKGDEIKGAISVRMRDGSEYDAEYIGYHRESDLALLKIDATDLAVIAFADPAKATVGNFVAVVGLSSEPVAVGVLSAGARKLFGPESFISKANKGVMGIEMGKPAEGDGVLITRVVEKSAAATAKLKVKDVILQVAGRTVNDLPEMQAVMDGYKPGDAVKLLIKRGDDEMAIEVKLGTRSDLGPDRGDMQNKMGSELSNRRTGFPKVIQTDAVVKPRDCGGPLVDLDGNVLGLTIARAGRVETWALPGDVVKPLVKDLIAGKYPAPAAEKK